MFRHWVSRLVESYLRVRNNGQDGEGRDGEERVVRHFESFEILCKLGVKVQ
jgi:hypothetical protein